MTEKHESYKSEFLESQEKNVICMKEHVSKLEQASEASTQKIEGELQELATQVDNIDANLHDKVKHVIFELIQQRRIVDAYGLDNTLNRRRLVDTDGPDGLLIIDRCSDDNDELEFVDKSEEDELHIDSSTECPVLSGDQDINDTKRKDDDDDKPSQDSTTADSEMGDRMKTSSESVTTEDDIPMKTDQYDFTADWDEDTCTECETQTVDNDEDDNCQTVQETIEDNCVRVSSRCAMRQLTPLEEYIPKDDTLSHTITQVIREEKQQPSRRSVSRSRTPLPRRRTSVRLWESRHYRDQRSNHYPWRDTRRYQ